MAAQAIAPELKPELLPVIRALGELHELVALVAGRSGEVLWTSDGLHALWGNRASDGAWLGRLARTHDAKLEERIADGAPLSDEPIRLVREDGTELPARISAARLAHDSACDATIAIFRLEEREEIAREFYHRVETLAEILDGSPDGVLVLDQSRFIRFANRALAEMVGEPPEALVDRPLASLVRSRDDLEHVAGVLRPADAPSWNEELELRDRDGRPATLSVHVRRLALADGTHLGAVIHLRDVTERRRIEAELARRAEELQHWVNAISHDLRSPLVAVLGFARLLREDYAETLDTQGLRFLQRIEDAGRTMESLVHDLLEFARIGSREPRRTHVDPRDVLLQLQAELKPRLEEARVSLHLPAEPPLLWCDRTQLYQVLSNLVGNAIDHMGAVSEPRIDVDVFEQDDLQHLVVRDHGCGIEASDQDRIFEIFQTAGPSNAGRGGTGIGLAVVRRVAEAHGGSAWVESTPGSGSAFHVTFRLA